MGIKCSVTRYKVELSLPNVLKLGLNLVAIEYKAILFRLDFKCITVSDAAWS
ncbi:hypothetical protein Ocin01_18351 [Orchesella cincta]|uniref:Uncharacterized protein n=1 Tax=Orchesella cincta TaxID=48709 RepID=A0A1D2M5S8_ORCCI|nr:hypothetical protein Ocin01_18351 [Orchesella cincta]